MLELDKLHIELLRACRDKDGEPLAEVLRLFKERRATPRRSDRTLYYRLDELAAENLVEFDKISERGRALCHVTEKGKEVLGRYESQTAMGA